MTMEEDKFFERGVYIMARMFIWHSFRNAPYMEKFQVFQIVLGIRLTSHEYMGNKLN